MGRSAEGARPKYRKPDRGDAREERGGVNETGGEGGMNEKPKDEKRVGGGKRGVGL